MVVATVYKTKWIDAELIAAAPAMLQLLMYIKEDDERGCQCSGDGCEDCESYDLFNCHYPEVKKMVDRFMASPETEKSP